MTEQTPTQEDHDEEGMRFPAQHVELGTGGPAAPTEPGLAAGHEPEPARPGPKPGRVKRAFTDFDLLNAIGGGITRFAGVEAPQRGGAPNFDMDTLRRSAAQVKADPRKRAIFAVFVACVAALSALIAWLAISGTLGDFYRTVYTAWPGEPWTDAMRDRPWIYAVVALVLSVVPFLLAPKNRWGRAFLTYVIFLVGFLGGHVFW